MAPGGSPSSRIPTFCPRFFHPAALRSLPPPFVFRHLPFFRSPSPPYRPPREPRRDTHDPRFARATPSPSLRAPPLPALLLYFHVSAEREDAELGQDWYLEPLQLTAPFSHRERRPPRRTAGARRLAPRRWGLKSSRPPFGFGQERRLQTRQPLPGWSPLEKS